jgi:murein L,D-transpeptidase YafK
MSRSQLLTGFLVLAWVLTGCAAHHFPVVPASLEADLGPTNDVKRQTRQPTDQDLIKRLLSENGYLKKGLKPTVLLVRKQPRKLTLYYGSTPIRTYPVVLGGNPVNDKVCQGDQCTPEGVYHVVCKYPHERWNKFILLDYPNTRNWLKYARAKKRGRISPLANIGGEIGIHGTDDDLKNILGDNWTLGCISLQNHHLDDIYPLINENTLVVIQSK